MKKIGVFLTIVLALALIVGCASSGGSSGGKAAAAGGATAEPYSVDLSPTTFGMFSDSANNVTNPGKGVRNTIPFAKRYDGVLFYLSGITADLSQYRRITINATCFDAKGEEIAPKDGNAMVVVIYDPKGDLKGPEMGAGKNTPLKEFNIGGFSGMVHKPNGSRLTLSQAPGAILLQCSSDAVKFIEITEVTFHNGGRE
jgi:hypothetical protein